MKNKNQKNKFFRNNFFSKNCKAMLLAEETLKTVIAVIAIGFLIYLLVSLYFSNQNVQEQKQAEGTLASINEIIKSSETEGMINAITPKGWYFFSFTGEIKPNACVGINCVCICSNVLKIGYSSWRNSEEERQAEECSEDGRCLQISNLEFFEEIEIKDPREELTNIKISKLNEKIVIRNII